MWSIWTHSKRDALGLKLKEEIQKNEVLTNQSNELMLSMKRIDRRDIRLRCLTAVGSHINHLQESNQITKATRRSLWIQVSKSVSSLTMLQCTVCTQTVLSPPRVLVTRGGTSFWASRALSKLIVQQTVVLRMLLLLCWSYFIFLMSTFHPMR